MDYIDPTYATHTITLHPEHALREMRAMGRSVFNRDEVRVRGVMTLRGRSRYLPHVGKKEAARHAGKTTLGHNASRALRSDIKIDPTIAQRAVNLPDIHFATLDRVTWTSSGKAKEGQIVAVVPAGKLPIDVDMKVKTDAAARDHVSYVVQSGKTLYWPRVSLLERV